MEGSGVNLGDYMDVVTTYHCKFCSHTCQTVKDMANHVQQDHLSEIVPLPQVCWLLKTQLYGEKNS